MKKQRKQFIVLLLLLASIFAGFAGIRAYNRQQSQQPGETDTRVKIVDLERDDIVKFSYDYEGVTYSFVKEEDIWRYEADKALNITESDVLVKLAKVCPMKAEQVIENVTDMKQYGLDNPARTLRFETAGESVILYVGDYNAVSKVYYVCKPSETTVYTVEGPYVNAFNYTVEDMIEEEAVSEGDNV